MCMYEYELVNKRGWALEMSLFDGGRRLRSPASKYGDPDGDSKPRLGDSRNSYGSILPPCLPAYQT